jgi:hypothetical protein
MLRNTVAKRIASSEGLHQENESAAATESATTLNNKYAIYLLLLCA